MLLVTDLTELEFFLLSFINFCFYYDEMKINELKKESFSFITLV